MSANLVSGGIPEFNAEMQRSQRSCPVGLAFDELKRIVRLMKTGEN
jgi:hypothetical protein